MPTFAERLLYKEGLKTCPKCRRTLSFDKFGKRMEGGKEYCTSQCLECQKETYRENRDTIREIRRQQRLGVPIGTYKFFVAMYGEKCAICGGDNFKGTSKESGQLHIDHDSTTGRIRGLLCGTCNVGIGMLKHDKEIMLAAISYLNLAGHSIDELDAELGTDLLSAEELGL